MLSGLVMPFRAAIAALVVPWTAAIEDSVSPGRTV
jgi:hypothetical protein